MNNPAPMQHHRMTNIFFLVEYFIESHRITLLFHYKAHPA